jgi:hypothetical protein
MRWSPTPRNTGELNVPRPAVGRAGALAQIEAELPSQVRRPRGRVPTPPANAGPNTAAEHNTVLDPALAQIPDRYRHGHPNSGPGRRRALHEAFVARVPLARQPQGELRVLRGPGQHRPWPIVEIEDQPTAP